MRKIIKLLFTVIIVGIFLNGCGGGGEDNNEDTNNIDISNTTITGKAIDGYIKDAKVCLDINKNDICDSDEPSATTDEDGVFTFNTTVIGEYPIIINGGIDTATNETFRGTLKNIIQIENNMDISTNITPLTTLAVNLVNEDTTITFDQAKRTISANLNIDQDKLDDDPMQDKDLFTTTQQIVQTSILLSTSISTTDDTDSFDFVMEQIALSVKDDNISQDLNITKLVTNIENTSFDNTNIEIENDITLFMENYIDAIKIKSEEIVDEKDLPTLQNEFKTFLDDIKYQIRNNNIVSLRQKLAGFTNTILDLSPISISLDNNISYNSLGLLDTNGSAKAVVKSYDEQILYIADGDEGLKIIDISNPMKPSLLGSISTGKGTTDLVLSNDGTKIYILDNIYVTKEGGLKIIDVVNPKNPILLGSLDTSGNAYEIVISSDNTKVYIADGAEGIKIINVSDSSSPTLLGSFDTRYAKDLILSNDETKIYIADDTEGIKIIDISDPSNITLISSLDTGTTYALAKNNDDTRLYLSDSYKGLQIIDISNLAIPTLINSDDIGSTHNIYFDEKNSMIYMLKRYSGIQLIDISNELNIVNKQLLSPLETPNDIIISNNLEKIYSVSSDLGLEILYNSSINLFPYKTIETNSSSTIISQDTSKLVVAKNDGGFQILDISNSLQPTILIDVNNTNKIAKMVLSSNNNSLFFIDSNYDLQIYDISNSTNPILKSTLQVGNYLYGLTISNDDKTLFIAKGEKGMDIINVSDMTNPTLLANFKNPIEENDQIIDGEFYSVTISADNQTAYIANRNMGTINGMHIADISNLLNPIALGTINTNGGSEKIVLSKDNQTAYIANGSTRLYTYDITNPTVTNRVSSIETGGEVTDIQLSNDESRLYVNCGSGGIKIIDITNQNDLQILKTIPTAGKLKISLNNSSLFVLNNDKVNIYDLGIDIIYKQIDFGTSNINLKISSKTNTNITLGIDLNSSDIITLGNYNQNLTPQDYNNGYISIPISSKINKIGTTLMNIQLTEGYYDEIRDYKIYINVFE